MSIVTPVYNGAKFLDECLDSVVAQTYENWELVIADNASTDATREIVLARAEAEPRIRVVLYDEFVDVISSFNRAFRLVSPQALYCKPLSADDLLYPACLERMVGLAERHPEVGLVGAYRLLGQRVDFTGFPPGVEVVSGPDVCRAALLGGVWLFGSASTTMLRADLVRRRDAFYDADFVHSDLLACYEVLQESSFGFVPEILTYTRRHSGAVTRKVAKLMTHRAEGVRIFLRYGRTHLDEREYERRLAVLVADYLWELCCNPRHLLDREVRVYHADVIRTILGSDPPSALVRGVMLQVQRMARGRRANGVDWLVERYGGSNRG